MKIGNSDNPVNLLAALGISAVGASDQRSELLLRRLDPYGYRRCCRRANVANSARWRWRAAMLLAADWIRCDDSPQYCPENITKWPNLVALSTRMYGRVIIDILFPKFRHLYYSFHLNLSVFLSLMNCDNCLFETFVYFNCECSML